MAKSALQFDLIAREALLIGAVSLGSLLILNIQPQQSTTYIVGLSLVQTAFFLLSSFRRLFRHMQHDDMSIARCLYSLGLMVTVFVIGYALNYVFLTLADLDALKNFSPPTLGARFFDALYFSLVSFTATGYGEVVPTTYPAKVVVSTEVIMGFVTTAFIISTFVSVRHQSNQNEE